MAKKFFRKELVSNSFLVKGKQVPFEIVEGNRGLIALDETPENADLISVLEGFSSKRKYGVVVISEAEYLEKKKLLKSVQPSKRKLEKLKVMQPLLKPKSPSPEKAAPVVNPDEVKALEQYRKDFARGVQEAKNGQQKQQSDNPAYNAGYASVSTPVGVVPSGDPSSPTPAFVPRTAPKPDAETKPVTK